MREEGFGIKTPAHNENALARVEEAAAALAAAREEYEAAIADAWLANGYSLSEIGAVAGLSKGGVYSLLQRNGDA